MIEDKLPSFSSSCQLSYHKQILNHEDTAKCRCINIVPYLYRSSQVRLDYSIFNSDITSKLISIFCMDLYGCSLWNFGSNYVKTFYSTK